MKNSLLRAYAEVDKILSFMQIGYTERVPEKLRKIFKNQKLKDYDPNIDISIPLNEQNLERKTYAILAMLDLHYWCNNEEEKQELLNIYSNNEKKRKEELREKYDYYHILKNRIKEPEQEKNTEKVTTIAEYKEENFVKKIINKIKKLFKR